MILPCMPLSGNYFDNTTFLYSLFAPVTHCNLKQHLLKTFPEKYLSSQINVTGFTLWDEMTI